MRSDRSLQPICARAPTSVGVRRVLIAPCDTVGASTRLSNVRLFVAVWPSEAVRSTLTGAVAPSASPRVRWVPAQNWHVTLVFLGTVADEQLTDLVDVLEGVVASSEPRVARLGPATALLGKRVLYIPVRGLDELATEIRRVVAPFGESEDREQPFVGHLTLARAGRRHSVPAALSGASLSSEWPVREVSLVSSTTRPEGAHYDSLFSFRLGGPGSP
ncbi:MAG: RNA 2',3'-cyclic phosphodiesterase [Acidimicrobiales bacterium]